MPGDAIDGASGYIYVFQGQFAGTSIGQAVTTWAFYNKQASNRNWVTPLVLVKEGGGRWRVVGIGTSRQNTGTGPQHYPFGLKAGSNIIQNSNYTFGWWNGNYQGASNPGVVEFSRVDSLPGFADSCPFSDCSTEGSIASIMGKAVTFPNNYSGSNPGKYADSGHGRVYSVAFFTSKPAQVGASQTPILTRAPEQLVMERPALNTSQPSLTSTDLPPTGPQPSVADGSGKIVPLYSASYALLISESNYRGGASKWRRLPETAEEMDRLAAVLRPQGFMVRRAQDVIGAELDSVIRSFLHTFGWDRDARILVYFSGHGFTVPHTDNSYIVPVDAPNPTDTSLFFTRVYPLANFDVVAREFPAKHALFLFDSCFSGGIFMTKSIESSTPAAELNQRDRVTFFLTSGQQPVRQFIAAGGPDQELPAQSVFLDLLIRALQGNIARNPDGYITGKELGGWLEQHLPSFASRSTPQNPHSDVIRDSRFVFGDMVFQIPGGSR